MSQEKLVEELTALFQEITEIDDIPAEKPLRDLGVDSMMALELVNAIEKKYTIKIAESELDQVSTLARAVNLVRTKIDAKKS